jgi:hypothetical protein
MRAVTTTPTFGPGSRAAVVRQSMRAAKRPVAPAVTIYERLRLREDKPLEFVVDA